MAVTPNLLPVEKALALLREGPLGPAELCRQVLLLQGQSEELSSRLAATMLEPDPRFCRLPDGRWTVTGYEQSFQAAELTRASFVVVDVETTGFAPPADRVIEIGMVKVNGCRIEESYETLIDPQRPIPGPITSLTGISYGMLAGCPTFREICAEVVRFIGEAVFVAHNAPFDWRFVQSEIALATGCRLLNPKLCTRVLARRLLPELERRNLDELARYFNLGFRARHRALGDAQVTAEVLLRFIERAGKKGITTLPALFEYLKPRKRSSTEN